MERDALSKAQNQVTQALRHMDDARKVQSLIQPLDAINIDQGHFISDVMFDSIFTDMAQNDRIKASEAQVERAVAQLEKTQVPEQQERVRRSKTEVLLAGQRLESARMELQRIRAEAFEKLVGDDQPPEYSG
ncbi:hypothetical protein KC315_g9236 [Hortaea werneckii]|nr:hypothetical protein KC315_g9236 [Hortaea werneckii]